MAITDKQLINYAEGQLCRPYWYGTFGQIGTPTLYVQKRDQYPSQYNKWDKKTFSDQFGQRVHDCVGLIKKCSPCEDISTLPDVKGLVVWKDGHIGIYIGGGYVIEARGHAYGVVKTKVTERPWTKWGRLPSDFVIYGSEPAPTPVFKPYEVKITADELNYRNGPGLRYKVNGTIKDKGGIYTIVAESVDERGQTWGKLKSGVGWISLKYTKRLDK